MMTLAVVAFLLLPAVAVANEPERAPTRASWWGATGMLEGWHVRIPLTVTNRLDFPLRDATASHDVDVRAALVRAGWTTAATASGRQLQVFELDERSARVIEYRGIGTGRAGDGVVVGEVPSLTRVGALDEASAFNARTNPALHIEWVLPGVTDADSTRYFMIYFDTVANGEKPGASYSEPARAPLEARGWISRGTILIGAASTLTLVGIAADTSARIEAYDFGKARLVEGAFENPVRLDAGAHRDLNVATEPQLLRIISDKPVIAYGLLPPSRFTTLAGPAPSVDGGVLGTKWNLHAGNAGLMFVRSTRDATVSVNGVVAGTVSTASPVLATPVTGVANIESTAPILTILWPSQFAKTQAPSLWGAPTGSQLFAQALVKHVPPAITTPIEKRPCTATELYAREGEVISSAFDAPAFVRGIDALTLDPLLPIDSSGKPSARTASVRPGELTSMQMPSSRVCPAILHTAKSSTDDAIAGTGRLVAFAGPSQTRETAFAGPLGGVNATRFITVWPAHVVALHDATLVTVREAGAPARETGLGRDDALDVTADGITPVEIVASKPVIVVPFDAGGYFAGIDDSLTVEDAGAPEYRGYLVSLHAAGDAREPLVATTGPGKAVSLPLVLKNLAQDARGDPVTDTFTLTFPDPPTGWSASLSETTVTLNGGESRAVTLTITPPPEVRPGASLDGFFVQAESHGNAAIKDRVSLVTFVRATYGVDVWFDRIDGARSRTITVDPGTAANARVVVKNTGPLPDRFVVNAAALSPEWRARIAEEGGRAPADAIEIGLGPGESRELQLRIDAPRVNASQSLVEIAAVSLSSAAASAKVTATVRIRSDVRLAVEVVEPTVEAPPGGTAVFHVIFSNRGTSAVSAKFNVSGVLPSGWSRAVVRYGSLDLDELSGIPPSSRVELNATLAIPVNASRDERIRLRFSIETIPDAVGDPVIRDGVDLLALVAARHDIVVEEASERLALSASHESRARLVLLNRGNGDERMSVAPTRIPKGSTLLLEPPILAEQDGKAELSFVIRMPTAYPPGEAPLELEVRTADGTATPWRMNVTVPEQRAVTFTPLSPFTSIAGVSTPARFELRNVGNVPLPLPPPFTRVEDWALEVTSAPGTLYPGASAVLDARVRAPSGADGSVDLSFEPTWAENAPFPWHARSVRLRFENATVAEGSIETRIVNAGTGDARDVQVFLTQNGERVDGIVIGRIAAGGEARVILGALPGKAEVVADPDGHYGASITMTLAIPEQQATPGLATIPLATAIVLAALASRRKSR